MVPLTDQFCWTPHRKILTAEQTQLPWLQLFGIQNSSRAEKPLESHIHPGCMEIVFLLKGFQIYETAGHLFRMTGYDIFVTRTEEPHSSGNFPEHISDLMWFQLRLSELPQTFQGQKASQLAEALQGLPRIFGGTPFWKANFGSPFLPRIPGSHHPDSGAGDFHRLSLPPDPAFTPAETPSGRSDQRSHCLYP